MAAIRCASILALVFLPASPFATTWFGYIEVEASR